MKKLFGMILIVSLTVLVFSVSGSDYPPGKMPTITPAIELQHAVNFDYTAANANFSYAEPGNPFLIKANENTYTYRNWVGEVPVTLRICSISSTCLSYNYKPETCKLTLDKDINNTISFKIMSYYPDINRKTSLSWSIGLPESFYIC